ncbi:MAG: GNAT family N-acetyltransferase [Dokdonella sp.]|uniref:GNAT family N-acetyltransferase n=1 Tax=Dokdonella sp. TaxID=2291710 RepID=UPI003F8161B0
MTVIVRTARTYDAAAIAGLCDELGYASTRQQVVCRLAAIEAAGQGCVLVAEDANGALVGWLHVGQVASLTSDVEGEILGLVVREAARGSGIGARLVEAAERWALAHGCTRMRVRSRVERERAHRFYERAGYARVKTQVVFGRRVASPLED